MRKFFAIFILFLISCLFYSFSFFLSPNIIFAEKIEENAHTDCRIILADIINEKEPILEQDIINHFTNSSPTSLLIEDAISTYVTFIDLLNATLDEWSRDEFDIALSQKTERISECEALIKFKKLKWENILKERVITTSTAKATNVLLDTYKSINEKLAELNLMVGMLKVYIQGFADNLPCYTQSCQVSN